LETNYMKRIILATAVIAAILVLLLTRPATEKIANPEVAVLKPLAARQPLEKSNSQDRIERKAATNAIIAKCGAAMTDEFIALMIDVLMKTREPRYTALFDKWGLPPADRNEVLANVRDRETQIKYALRQFRLDGLDGGKLFVETTKTISGIMDVPLGRLLGEEKFKEMVALESAIKKGEVAKGMAIIDD
jgi:hypothetical protein